MECKNSTTMNDDEFRTDLRKKGFEIVDIPDGSNCLVEAIAQGLALPGITFQTVRTECAAVLKQCIRILISQHGYLFGNNDNAFILEAENMDRPGFRGGAFAIVAACHRFLMQINVCLPSGLITSLGNDVHVHKQIFLSFHYGTHFNLLIKHVQSAHTVAQRFDPLQYWKDDPDDHSFRQDLQNAGYVIMEIQPNGNSLYEAIAAGLLHHPQQTQRQVRTACYTFINGHLDRFMVLPEYMNCFFNELALINADDHEGGVLAIKTACYVYGINIVVHHPHGRSAMFKSVFQASRTIYLSLHNSRHYNLLLPFQCGSS